MISTEVLIVMLIFLVYIGIWITYMDSFMGAVQQAMQALERRAVVDSVVHKANIACVSNGEEIIDFGKEIEVNINGKKVAVGSTSREAGCEFASSYTINSSKIGIKKENGLLVARRA